MPTFFCMSEVELSQSLQLLQFVKSSSLDISDLVLHQVAAMKKQKIIHSQFKVSGVKYTGATWVVTLIMLIINQGLLD